MQLINNNTSFFIDIDKTLIFDPDPEAILPGMLEQMGISTVKVVNPYDGVEKTFVVHKEHVALVKHHKARGFSVVVWSNNGAEYAFAVAKALGLEPYVDWAMSKPTKACDDLSPEKYMPASIYIKDNAYLKGFGIKLDS